jgi:tyrosinase
MRSSILLIAASSAAASVLPIVNLPASAFPAFTTLSHEDAINGLDLLDGLLAPLEHNSTHSTQSPESIVPSVQTAEAAACAANPNMRYEWRDFSLADRTNFMDSIVCLIKKPASGNFAPATNRFEDLARLHQLYMPNVHGNAKFLMWHRYFLWTFEQVLRDECGLTAPFPWWDETKDAGHFAALDLFGHLYFGWLTGPDSNGNPVCVTSGAFAGLTAHIGPGMSNTPHCLSRAGTASLTAECNSNFVNTCNSRTSYADMESCTEGG